MSNELIHQSIYNEGRFRLREETDYAIIDELEEFPPIMIISEISDNGSESIYADKKTVLHILNQLADTNPNEERHFYLKYRLNKVHNENYILRKEIQKLKKDEYKQKVEKILQQYFNQYTIMAVKLRNDKYANSMCHDVTEVIAEIADKLDIGLKIEVDLND